MLKKTVTYTDFNGEKQTEDLYFNMSNSELVLMLGSEENFVENLNEIAKANDAKKIIAFYTDFIKDAYGERSEDGKRFVKSPEKSLEFSQTAAFDAVLGDILMGADDPVAFLKAIVPVDLANKMEQQGQPGKPQDFRQSYGK